MKDKRASNSVKSLAQSIVPPKCGHNFPLSKKEARAVAQASCSLDCVECRKPIPGEPVSFAGRFACEACVTAHYQTQGPEIVALEIRERRSRAASILRFRR